MFKFLKGKLKGFLGTTSIKWNFSKFLIDRNGVPFKRYGSNEAPMTFEDDIKRLLDRPSTYPLPAALPFMSDAPPIPPEDGDNGAAAAAGEETASCGVSFGAPEPAAAGAGAGGVGEETASCGVSFGAPSDSDLPVPPSPRQVTGDTGEGAAAADEAGCCDKSGSGCCSGDAAAAADVPATATTASAEGCCDGSGCCSK